MASTAQDCRVSCGRWRRVTGAVPNPSGDVEEGAGSAALMSESELAEVFACFRRYFAARDFDGLLSVWTPDLEVWHSVDCRVKDRDEYLEFIAKLPVRTPRFVDVRRDYFANGFVQQQTVEITQADGRVDKTVMCLVVKMEDGRISRIDEYVAFPPEPS